METLFFRFFLVFISTIFELIRVVPVTRTPQPGLTSEFIFVSLFNECILVLCSRLKK